MLAAALRHTTGLLRRSLRGYGMFRRPDEPRNADARPHAPARTPPRVASPPMILLGSGVFACGTAIALVAATVTRRVAGLATAGAGALLALLDPAPDPAARLSVVAFTGVPLAVVATYALHLARVLRRREGTGSLADETELG